MWELVFDDPEVCLALRRKALRRSSLQAPKIYRPDPHNDCGLHYSRSTAWDSAAAHRDVRWPLASMHLKSLATVGVIQPHHRVLHPAAADCGAVKVTK